MFWQITEDRKVNKLRAFKVPSDRTVRKIDVVAPGFHEHEPNLRSDRIIVIFKSGESELFDF